MSTVSAWRRLIHEALNCLWGRGGVCKMYKSVVSNKVGRTRKIYKSIVSKKRAMTLCHLYNLSTRTQMTFKFEQV